MKKAVILLGAALMMASPVSGFAGTGKAGHCPPGLAKKNPPCIPPGQAKKFGIGDRITGDYDWIRNPGRYGLDPNETYYRVGDQVYRVDRDTKEVLDLIGAVYQILN